MSTSLSFNEVSFIPVPVHNNDSIWLRAADIARALGYQREDKVSRLYQRNADEFTPDMTQVIEITADPHFGTENNLSEGRCRIFSLRGCHLLAMFSRTPVAKAFRKWVLDVLDRMAEEERAALPGRPASLTPSTADDRKPLRSLVHAWAQIAGTSHTALWPQVKAHFQLARIDDLPVEWIGDALAFVQGKIDATGKALPQSNSELAAASSLQAYSANLPLPEFFDDDISDKEKDKRLKKVLRELHVMQEKCGGLFDEIRICLAPHGRKMFLPANLDNTYKTLQHLNFSATAGVYMTRQALISAYHIGKGVEFC